MPRWRPLFQSKISFSFYVAVPARRVGVLGGSKFHLALGAIIIKVIYQDQLMNINYKDFPCHGAVICNFCRNCFTVRSRDPFQGIILKNIHRMIEIVHNQLMLAYDEHVRVTVKVFLLLSAICQDCINSHGSGDGGNRSFTNNPMPCQCRFLTVGLEGNFSWCLWC